MGSPVRIPIVYRYVLREILSPFFVAIFVFTGILFLARSLKLVDLVVNKNVPVGDILLLFSYIVPSFLELAIPMSLLLAVILAFGRLSADSELVVLRSVGMSLKQLARPVISLSIVALICTMVLGFWIRPWATYQLGRGLFEIAKQQTSAGLVGGAFNDMGTLTVYAENIEDEGARLNNVIIGDRREENLKRTFLAKYGKIVSNSQQRSLTLQLFDGSIQEGAGLNFDVTEFEINSVQLPHSELVDERPAESGKRSKEMFFGELAETVDNLPESTEGLSKDDRRSQMRYRVELQRRIALPFSCVSVALIALALGIQPSRGGQSWGAAVNVAMGVLTILSYYLLFALATALAEQEVAPTWFLLWIPNVLFFSLGLYLFQRMGSEQWLAVSQALGDKLIKLFTRLRVIGRESAQ